MNLGLELHVEARQFTNKENEVITYNAYYVLVPNYYNGELEKVYLSAGTEAKTILKLYTKALKQNK